MGRILKRSSTWQLLSGIVLAEIGVALVGYGKWDSLQTANGVDIWQNDHRLRLYAKSKRSSKIDNSW